MCGLTLRFPRNSTNYPMEDERLVLHVPSALPSPTRLVGLEKEHRTTRPLRRTPPTPIRSAEPPLHPPPSSPHFVSYYPTSTSFIKSMHITICLMDPRTLGDDYKGKVNPSVPLAIFFQLFSLIKPANLRPPLLHRIRNYVNRKTIGN